MSNKRRPVRLSASAVKAFLECPYRYAMDHVQRLPQHQREPFPALAFGNVVHRTLACFIQQGGWDHLNCDDLLSLFADFWDGAVYSDRDAEYRSFVRGKDMLERFYASSYPRMTKELGVELSVSWRKPHRGIVAVGKIDRARLLNDETLEVIDYKTGRSTSSNLASDTQALFYRTLAAETFEELRPKSIRITFLHLEDLIPVSAEFEKERFQLCWKNIEETARAILDANLRVDQGFPLEQAFPRRREGRCGGCQIKRHCETDGEQQKALVREREW